ncbi:MAG: hypothetical protein WCK06_04910 [Actinomycetota bacterium]
MSEGAERIRTLLLRADNVLKHAGSANPQISQARLVRAREALLEAQLVATQPGVDLRVAELVQRRLAGLDALEGRELNGE